MKDFAECTSTGINLLPDAFHTCPPLMYHEPLCFTDDFKVRAGTNNKLFYAYLESTTYLLDFWRGLEEGREAKSNG